MEKQELYRLLAAGAAIKTTLEQDAQGANDFRWLTDIVKCDWKELFQLKKLDLSDNELSLAEKARIREMLPNCELYI